MCECVYLFFWQAPAGVKAAQGEPTGLFSKISHLRCLNDLTLFQIVI